MIEKLIEQDGVNFAKARGWSVYKWASPGTTGVHDRIHFKGHVTFTLEYKTTGKKATPKQRIVAQDLKYRGIPSRCCDTAQTARNFITRMTHIVDQTKSMDDLKSIADDISSFDP